ncbi:glycosyltransferase [Chitinolyticbacter albus]|uniref:glycosyltransferase n=1 Tax=Chitinolyticbacter albus TaxID=2961951 RepID=UPI00210B497B|nr:glycosyltransferase [Chitinolyticbacter albus]
MKAPQLSIVAAVYNNAGFIAQFFECLLAQQLDDYELILVDDGSSDDTLAVIEAWRDRFAALTVISQPNQGVSVARNTGLAAARGEYVAFPDTDDVFRPGMYRTLLEMAARGDLDVATCNGVYVYDDGRPSRPIFPHDRLQATGVIGGPEWLQRGLASQKFLHVTWLNIYRRSLLVEQALQFEPGLHHQDIVWTTALLLAAKRVQYTDAEFYEYLIHSASVSHQPGTNARRMKSARNYMRILELLDGINARHADTVQHLPECRWQIAKEGLGILHSINNIDDMDQRGEIVDELFSRGIWALIWRNATGLKQHWRLARRYAGLRRALRHHRERA